MADNNGATIHTPNSFIKDIAFELPADFVFAHSPWEKVKENRDDSFIGRDQEEKKFVAMLNHSKGGKGVYLVTGYRGVGKTSFVTKVVEEYSDIKKENKSLLAPVNIHISTSETEEVDILRQITSKIKSVIYANSKTNKILKSQKKNQRLSGFLLFLSIVACWLTPYLIHTIGGVSLPDVIDIKKVFGFDMFEINNLHKLIVLLLSIFIYIVTLELLSHVSIQIKGFHAMALFTIVLIASLTGFYFFLPVAFFGGYLFFSYAIYKALSNQEDPYNKITNLFHRAYSNVSTDSGPEIDISSVNEFLGKLNIATPRKTMNYPLASSKELEEEILEILKCIKDNNEYKNGDKSKGKDENILDYFVRPFEIIFIFDELDKVNIKKHGIGMYDELEKLKHTKEFAEINVDENRSRKSTIINILGNLKSFFSQADAKFVFIAGREMFDASLADVSDRQSLLSSIFNHVFYLNSFLKEISNDEGYKNKFGITNLIEEYLIKTITQHLNIKDEGENRNTIEGYFERYIFKKGSTQTFAKKNNSNAIPKKSLKQLIMLQSLVTYLAYRSNGSPKKLQKTLESFIVIKSHANDFDRDKTEVVQCGNTGKTDEKAPKLYLVLAYNEQYRIGFINYLFRPFIINKSNYLKSLSDNTLVTTPYVLDHLIKFHPFAFSMHNLEQIPEILSVNSTEAHRSYIQSLVEYLGRNHVRETHCSLFSYKFVSESENEFNYITLKYEEEAAAFNFTLDETYQVKLQIRTKIKELRSIFLQANTDNKQIYSISFLNSWLGDTYFFDQQYDDAIIAYSDAIKEIGTRDFHKMNYRDFSLLLNLKQKQGLCLEKAKSYYDTLSFYVDAVNNSRSYIRAKVSLEHDNFATSVVGDLLQVVMQSLVAKAYVQEKIGLSGYDLQKSVHNVNTMQELIYSASSRVACNNYLVLGNYFLSLGNLYYYKNNYLTTNQIKILFGAESDTHYRNYFRGKKYFNHSTIEDILQSIKAGKNTTKGESTECLYPAALVYYITSLVCIRRYYMYNPDHETSSFYGLVHDVCDKYNDPKDYYTLTSDIERNNDNTYAKKIFATILSFISDTFIQLVGDEVKVKYYDNFKGDVLAEKIGELERKTIEKCIYIISCKHKGSINDVCKTLCAFGGKTIDDDNTILFRIYMVIAGYFWSSKQYGDLNNKLNQSFQLKKILYLIRSIITKKNNVEGTRLIPVIKENLLYKIEGLNSEISDVADIKQTQKYLNTIDKNLLLSDSDAAKDLTRSYIKMNLSTHPSTKEANLICSHIEVTVSDRSTDVYEVGNYNTITTQYSRIGELLFEEKRCWTLIDSENQDSNADSVTSEKKVVDNEILIDHLFACLSVIRISNILKTNTMISNSLIGHMYYKIGYVANEYIKDHNVHEIIESLNSYIKEDIYPISDPDYYFINAKLYFERALSLHTNGNEYKKKIDDMFYLEDDYNDESNHFGIGLERLYINSGKIEGRIEYIKNFIKNKNNV